MTQSATTTPSGLARAIRGVGRIEALDGPADLLGRVGRGAPRRYADRAFEILGHPVHPALTDLPIGFWTSAWVLDLMPGRARTAFAARRLIGLGVLSTVPTVLSGLGDAAGMGRQARRTASVHAALNVAATAAFAASWWLRRRGPTARAVTLSHTGAALATLAAALGGHLTFDAGEPDPVADRDV